MLLSDLNGEILLQPQTVPLVIDSDNLALQGLAGSITVFPEQRAVEPPFKVKDVSSLVAIILKEGTWYSFRVLSMISISVISF